MSLLGLDSLGVSDSYDEHRSVCTLRVRFCIFMIQSALWRSLALNRHPVGVITSIYL
jgi:hypothetical protein